MDAYPEDYTAHNLPFIALSGLEGTESRLEGPGHPSLPTSVSEGGLTLASQLPPVTGERAGQLLHDFADADASNAPWNSKDEKGKIAGAGFKLRLVGRDFKLPPRKAEPPLPTSPSLSPIGKPAPERRPSWILHSPISPLSPGSPIFPDGLMTPFWLSKHQYNVPAVFICFFEFTSDPNRNSLNDNQLKSEVNRMKGLITQSGYKTRFVAVLLSDKTILEAPDIEERLAVIRRATGLDPKNSLFFVPPNTSRVEIASFVSSLLSTLQPICVEYYRELTKHARRKKSRGQIPAPTIPPTRGTSQALAGPGWQVRYEFKLGVFAEFRREMDAAGRHYGLAFDALLASDGPFETTPTWSPRWDEYRLLADIIALRLLRCQLWNNTTTIAVQSWSLYRDRIRDVLNRRGKGSKNYGWAAWETRWAMIMAEVIEKAELPIFALEPQLKNTEGLEDRIISNYALPEKAIPVGERLNPWHHLHHPGYWYRLAATYAKLRLQFAVNIPDEDRTPPGQSPAAVVASRYGTYDTYLCPEPHIETPLSNYGQQGFDHTANILNALSRSTNDFTSRQQQRWIDRLQLDAGKELLRAGRVNDALAILRPLWERMQWRKEGWWSCVRDVCETASQCAVRAGDQHLFIATQWELLSNVLYTKSSQKQDFMRCLDRLEGSTPSVESRARCCVSLQADKTISFLTATCTFDSSEAYVGEPLQTQLSIYSDARANSAPLIFQSIRIEFEGCLGQIEISHGLSSEQEIQSSSVVVLLTLQETVHSSPSRLMLQGEADLSIYPGQRKVFNFALFFREAGEVTTSLTHFVLAAPKFDISYSTTRPSHPQVAYWWLQDPTGQLHSKRVGADNTISLRVLPKPPKMEVRVLDSPKHYYIDESVTVEIEVTNGEEEETAIVLEARFFSRSGDVLQYHWETSVEEANIKRRQSADSPIDLPGQAIGNLAPGEKHVEKIIFTGTTSPSEHVLEIKALYHLLSDLETPLSKTIAQDILFQSPFEANYELSPRIHPEAWPGIFTLPIQESDTKEAPEGIKQRWNLTTTVVSFAEESLLIESTVLVTQTVTGGIVNRVGVDENAAKALDLAPQQSTERNFEMDIQKPNLDDRRPCSLEMSLAISWRRPANSNGKISTSETIITRLPIPRLTIPILEPRVILTSTSSNDDFNFMTLTYALENPTLHFLTFDIGMEATEAFAFSGPKLRAVNLLPMTRQSVEYKIVPLVGAIGKDGGWLYPQFRAVDRYFGKTLKVLAGQGAKDDGKEKDGQGVGVWVKGY